MKLVFNWTSIKGHPVSGVSTVRDAYLQTETHDRFGGWDHEIQKIWNGVSTVLVAGVVLLAVLLVGVRLFGLQVYTVLSGSMEPAYPVGSLIYVKKTAAED